MKFSFLKRHQELKLGCWSYKEIPKIFKRFFQKSFWRNPSWKNDNPIKVSRAAHLHAKQEQEKETPLPPPQPVVNEISSEIEKMAIISPRPSRKSDATKRQTKISNFFRKSSS